MTKIQIIIDDEKSLKGFTCTGVEVERLIPDPGGMYKYGYEFIPQVFKFNCTGIISDDSPNLISLPDELLLRIRDYNIDTEYKHTIEQTFKLKEKIESLKDQVRGWEFRRDLAMEDYERYHNKILKMIDRYPMAAAEIAFEDHDLECVCYYANKANEEEEENA